MPSNEKNPTYLLAEPEPIKQPRKELDPAQQLLTWLQKWNRPTIRMNDILVYGPRPAMRKRAAIGPVETLVRHKWLIPIPTRRSNMSEWKIVRPAIVDPVIES
jgi:hypothetical protein